jgi:manganese/iron transport system ATP-binding protein
MTTALRVENLSVSYGAGLALQDVTFSADVGERVAIVGPNGAGKSTLFRALIGQLPPASGRILFDANGSPARIGYLPQRTQADLRFPVTVFDVVLMGRVRHTSWLRWPSAEDRRAAQRALEQVGMREYAGRQIGELSGGQQQRVFIARALAQEAGILLMDEPFSGVDLPSQEAILSILDGLRAQAITVLVSTHDLNLAAERFDRLALLNRRLIAYGPAGEAITRENLVKAYGGQAVWSGDGYALVMGDIACCGAAQEHEIKS